MLKPATSRLSAILLCLTLSLAACDQLSWVTGRDRHVRPAEVSAESLQKRAGDLQAFYEGRQWRPAWTPAGAGELVRTLEGAWRHGIDPGGFKAMVSAEDPAEREIELTRMALSYADALADGLADPRTIFPI